MTINLESLKAELCRTFCRDVGVTAHGENEVAVHLPMVGRDGDHLTVYVSEDMGGWRISDKGITMMRLSYENDLDRLLSGARARLFQTVLNESGLEEDDGELISVVSADSLIGGLFSLGQGIVRIEDMGLWTRTRVESAFYDDLREIIASVVPEEGRIESFVVPDVHDAGSYPVDYMIKTPGKPLYLFGVLNRDKARLATIILQHLSKHAKSFDSMVVFSDMDEIPSLDRRRLIAAANDVVPSIQDRAVIEQKILHRLAA